MSQLGITAINVFVEIDGKQYIALIKSESADMFIGMLPAYQAGGDKVHLAELPTNVVAALLKTRTELGKAIEAAKNLRRA